MSPPQVFAGRLQTKDSPAPCCCCPALPNPLTPPSLAPPSLTPPSLTPISPTRHKQEGDLVTTCAGTLPLLPSRHNPFLAPLSLAPPSHAPTSRRATSSPPAPAPSNDHHQVAGFAAQPPRPDLLTCTPSLAPHKQEGDLFTTCAGTLQFMAPEVLLRQYAKHADVWSCGVILAVMLTGCYPFPGSTTREQMHYIVNEPISFQDNAWQGISGALLWAVRGRASQVCCCGLREVAVGNVMAGHLRCVAVDTA